MIMADNENQSREGFAFTSFVFGIIALALENGL